MSKAYNKRDGGQPPRGPKALADSSTDHSSWDRGSTSSRQDSGRHGREHNSSKLRPGHRNEETKTWGSKKPANEVNWAVPLVESKAASNDAGWGSVAGGSQQEAPGWGFLSGTTDNGWGRRAQDEERKGVSGAGGSQQEASSSGTADNGGWAQDEERKGASGAGDWGTHNEEKRKGVSDSQPGGFNEGGWGSPKKTTNSFGERYNNTSRRDGHSPDKGRSDWSRRSSWSATDSRADEPSWGPSDQSRSSKVPRDSSKHDASAPQDDHQHVDWTDVPRSGRQRAVSPTGTEQTSTTSQLISKLNLPPSILNIKDEWRQIVALFGHGVMLELEVRKATSERDRFKKAQVSKVYLHTGPAGCTKLDNLRLQFEESLADNKRKYTDVLKMLAKYHEFPRPAFNFDPKNDEAEVKRYTDEAKVWIATIRKTLLAATADATSPPEPLEDSAMDVCTVETASAGSKRTRQATPTIEAQDLPRSTIATRVHDLEDRIEKLRGDLLLSSYTAIRNTVDEKIETRFAALALAINPKVANSLKSGAPQEDGECTPDPLPLPVPSHQVAEFAQTTEVLGSKVAELTKSRADVLAKVHLHEEELKCVRAENEQLKQSQASLLDRLAQCQRFQEQSKREVQEMSDMLQSVYTQRALAPPETSLSPNIPPEELKEEIASFVRTLVEQAIGPIISTVNENCTSDVTNHKETVYQEFWTKVSGPLKMSEAISLILDARAVN